MRLTESLPAPVRRDVCRIPFCSKRWFSTLMALSSGSRQPESNVPFRSEKWARQTEQNSMRMAFLCPDHPFCVRFPRPFFPKSGHSLFWQQNSSIGRMASSFRGKSRQLEPDEVMLHNTIGQFKWEKSKSDTRRFSAFSGMTAKKHLPSQPRQLSPPATEGPA